MDNIIKYDVGSNAIKHLLTVSNTIELSYVYLQSKTTNDDIKSWIEDHLSYTLSFKQQSISILKTLNSTQKELSNSAIKLKYSFLKVKSLFYKIEDDVIINECLKLNAYFLNELNKEMKSGILSKSSYNLLNTLKNNLLTTKQDFYFSRLRVS
ncbi:hypothetical protein [Psychroserpens sp. NJDZ02]|uniref:hypothetical protein n=1 Tax=Psychroserpens sp. NJDZ02 TaxID=2570561 RepID=UPI0010A8F859|nr:hypothetical protein [Psychroserpens sp. NJDZ02]QCE41009.1 hypothetical protein E9099_06110 [Psychroserpens sp. NJDZ02]